MWDDEEEFKSACSNRVADLRKKGAHLFLVCVDGSDQGDVAFHATMNLRRKYDYLAMFHAFRGDSVDRTASHYRPASIKEQYECQLVTSVPSDQYSIHMFDRKGRDVVTTLKQALSQYSSLGDSLPDDIAPDFVVMGHHGRKGAKSHHTALGSTSDLALRGVHIPCIVIKNRVPRGPKSYVMAVNGAEVSSVSHFMCITAHLIHVVTGSVGVEAWSGYFTSSCQLSRYRYTHLLHRSGQRSF